MKAKRFLSLLLSLTLAVSLAAPALAEGGIMSEEEFRIQYLADHPELFDPEAFLEEMYGESWPKEEYMSDMGLESEEAFRESVWQEYVDYGWSYYFADFYGEMTEAYYVYLEEAYESAHPGELAALSTEELLARLGYTDTLTPEEQFMKNWDLDSEDQIRPTLLRNYIVDRMAVEETHAAFLTYQEKYAEEWETFDADAYYEQEWNYNDKAEYMNMWNLFTEEEFAENMFVDYVDSYLRDYDYDDNWYWDGDDYDRIITLCANGETIDTDVTAADGVTYADSAVLNDILGTQFPDSDPISIRYAAETAGWDVVWNSYRRQVVLLDRERLLTGVIVPGLGWVEEDISGLDRLAEKARTATPLEPGKSYRTTGTVELTYTALNSLDGDETYTAQIKVETLTRGKVSEMSLSMDLAELLRLAPDMLLEEVTMELPKTARDLKTLLNGVKAELIWNGETGMLYVNIPIVALVDPTPGVDADTWYAFDLSELLEVETQASSVSKALYQSLLESSETGWGGADSAYSDFLTQKGLLHILFGPHAVTEKEGTLTWKLDEEMISGALSTFMGAIGEPGNWDEPSLFKECELEMTIDPKGNTGLSMALRPDMEGIAAAIYGNGYHGYGYYGLFAGGLLNLADFRYTAKGQSSAKGSRANVELHWKNSFKLELDMDTARQEVKTVPRTTPPDGTEIVEI